MTRIRVFFGVLEISKLWPAFQTSGASSWLVAGRPSLSGSPRCREALVAGRPFSGGHILEKGPPPRSARKVLQILYLMAKFNVAKSGLDF